MSDDRKPKLRIGLFDSGVGGLSVYKQLRGLRESMPDTKVEFIYVGDTARCPYGNRDKAEVRMFIDQIVTWLRNKDVDAIVMACNTSAAHGRDVAVSAGAPLPVHDLITCTAEDVAERFERVAVMATNGTAKTAAFSNAIRAINPSCMVKEIGCPRLVPLVESGQLTGQAAEEALSEYTNELLAFGAQGIILGCTHFPFLSATLRKILPDNIELIDPATLISREIHQNFFPGQQNAKNEELQADQFYTTGDPTTFAEIADVCLGLGMGSFASQNLVRKLSLLELELPKDFAAELAPQIVPGVPTSIPLDRS